VIAPFKPTTPCKFMSVPDWHRAHAEDFIRWVNEHAAPALESALPDQRRLDWQAEHRYLAKRIQQDQRRKQELEEMLAAFFPEVRR
jgi:hypothetical protein